MENHSGNGAVAPFEEERRFEGRSATVFRPVLIEAEHFTGFCLVRNLSPNGMRARVYTTFAVDQPISVLFSSELVVQGNLVWSEEEHIGVRFDQSIDVQEVLANLSRKVVEGKLNRALRLPIHCTGELAIADRTLKMEVQDISQRGVKVVSSFVRPGDEVVVQLEGLAQRTAIVRWVQAGVAGLNFIRPLGFDELAQWVVEKKFRGDVSTRPREANSAADHALIELGGFRSVAQRGGWAVVSAAHPRQSRKNSRSVA